MKIIIYSHLSRSPMNYNTADSDQDTMKISKFPKIAEPLGFEQPQRI